MRKEGKKEKKTAKKETRKRKKKRKKGRQQKIPKWKESEKEREFNLIHLNIIFQ